MVNSALIEDHDFMADNLPSTLTFISAPLSLLGSCTIIYVISRSKDKLKTTMNRLLLGLCIGDIFLTLPMLFTKAIVKVEDLSITINGNMYSYQIPVITSRAACDTQGFFITLGSILSPFYNCSLCVYYICVIKLSYTDAKITKKVEPFLHAVPWLWAMSTAIFALASKSLFPNGGYCTLISTAHFWALQLGPWLIIFFAICIQMAVVYHHVWRQDRRMTNAGYARAGRGATPGSEPSMIAGRQPVVQATPRRGSLRQPVSNSRTTLYKAFAYAGAYFCTYIFIFVDASIYLASREANDTISYIAIFLYPLQGKSQSVISVGCWIWLTCECCIRSLTIFFQSSLLQKVSSTSSSSYIPKLLIN